MDDHRRTVLALLASLGAGCVDAPSSNAPIERNFSPQPTMGPPPEIDDETLATLVDGNTVFALDLYAELISRSPGENLFVSPYSVSVALAMTWLGADGNTATDMAETLRFALDQDELHATFQALNAEIAPPEISSDETTGDDSHEQPQFQLRTANALWGQDGFPFDESFVETLATHYGAGMNEVDFQSNPDAARRIINGWVEERTEGKVEDLLPADVIDTYTRLVLTNAIYFQARWLNEFDKQRTEEGTFTNLDGSTTEMSMMTTTEGFPYAELDGHQVVELPYASRDVSMVVVLPAEGAFESFERNLDGDRLASLFDALEPSGVSVTMPRFTVELAFSLKDSLSALGMEVAFDPSRANFDGMIQEGADAPDLYVKDAVHKTFVDVDEKGTEAAAATGVVMAYLSATIEQFDVTVNRPFLFFIRHRETDTVLFAGRVVDGDAAQ